MHLTHFTCYETKTRLYLVGSNTTKDEFRITKIDKTIPNELSFTEDKIRYSQSQINELLGMISIGNKLNGGLRKLMDFCGVFGFTKFLDGYYLILITEKSPVALLGGNYIYHIDNTTILPINVSSKLDRKIAMAEQRYLQIFSQIDLTKNFYFSLTYDISQPLQYNLSQGNFKSPNEMFLWNEYLTKKVFDFTSVWYIPIIYGFVDQSKISVYGHNILITLIARRSRHFAGARFLKRGVSEKGYVANDVETEQIVNDENTTSFTLPINEKGCKPAYTSFLQHRGSIPLYWGQDTASMAAKPLIHLDFVDPFYSACAKHFNDLFYRYGTPLIILNLVKAKEKTKRESILLDEFTQAVNYLNQSLPDKYKIQYIAWDMSRASKSNDQDVVGTLENIATDVLKSTGFFHSGSAPFSNSVRNAYNEKSATIDYEVGPRYQQGILRTNCIDCLDRTNAAQFVVGKCALGLQLHALGVIPDPLVPFDSDAVNIFNALYHDHGDTIALQYGGSHLVNTMETYRKMSAWTSHSRDMIERIRRYYSNLITDAEKQDSINLFLGYFDPTKSPVDLWDLNSDFYLHNLPPIKRPPIKSYYNWWDEDKILNNRLSKKMDLKALDLNVESDIQALKEYYNPTAYSTLDKIFSFRMMSTNFSTSCFTPRINPAMPSKSLIIYNLNIGGVRQWLRPANRQITTEKPPIAQNKPSVEQKTDWNSDTITAKLLNPTVSQEEQHEYKRYLNQFRQKLLSDDLSTSIDSLVEVEDELENHQDFKKFTAYVDINTKYIKEVDSKDEHLFKTFVNNGYTEAYIGLGAKSQDITRYANYNQWYTSNQPHFQSYQGP